LLRRLERAPKCPTLKGVMAEVPRGPSPGWIGEQAHGASGRLLELWESPFSPPNRVRVPGRRQQTEPPPGKRRRTIARLARLRDPRRGRRWRL